MPSYRIFNYYEILEERSWISFFIVLLFMIITIVYSEELEQIFRVLRRKGDEDENKYNNWIFESNAKDI